VALGLGTLAIGMGTLFAGAMDGAARKTVQLDARITATVSTARGDRVVITSGPRYLSLRNTTLRELVAMAYDVAPHSVEGDDAWLDSQRYDIHAEIRDALIDDEVEPAALRHAVNELLASNFNLQVHVNQRCQQPCGRRALIANASP
jgi:uncharacterized protein (TIGR03435 family)